MESTERTPEGTLIRESIDRSGMSIRAVAREVPISDTQLRYWFRGRDGKKQDVHFPSRQLARVAQILQIPSEQLRAAGRDDAAVILDQMLAGAPTQDVANMSHEELVRMVMNLAKRLGDVEDENEHLRERIDEHFDEFETR